MFSLGEGSVAVAWPGLSISLKGLAAGGGIQQPPEVKV